MTPGLAMGCSVYSWCVYAVLYSVLQLNAHGMDETPADVSLRLTGGFLQDEDIGNIEGIVEIWHDGNWTNICWDDFTKDAANKVCRNLLKNSHFNHGEKYEPNAFPGNLSTNAVHLNCTSAETYTECVREPDPGNNCTKGGRVAAVCCNDGIDTTPKHTSTCSITWSDSFNESKPYTPCYHYAQAMSYTHAVYSLSSKNIKNLPTKAWTASRMLRVKADDIIDCLGPEDKFHYNVTNVTDGVYNITGCASHCLQNAAEPLRAIGFTNEKCYCFFKPSNRSTGFDFTNMTLFAISESKASPDYCIAMRTPDKQVFSFFIENCSRAFPVLCDDFDTTARSSSCETTKVTTKAYSPATSNTSISPPDDNATGSTPSNNSLSNELLIVIGVAVFIVIAVFAMAIVYRKNFKSFRKRLSNVEAERQRPNSISNRTYRSTNLQIDNNDETYDLINDMDVEEETHIDTSNCKPPPFPARDSDNLTLPEDVIMTLVDYTTPSDRLLTPPDTFHAEAEYTTTYDDPIRQLSLIQNSETVNINKDGTVVYNTDSKSTLERHDGCLPTEDNPVNCDTNMDAPGSSSAHGSDVLNECEASSSDSEDSLGLLIAFDLDHQTKDTDYELQAQPANAYYKVQKDSTASTDRSPGQNSVNDEGAAGYEDTSIIDGNFKTKQKENVAMIFREHSENTEEESDYEDTTVFDGIFKTKPKKNEEVLFKEHVCLHDLTDTMLSKLGIRIVSDPCDYSTCATCTTCTRRGSDLTMPTYYNTHENIGREDESIINITSMTDAFRTDPVTDRGDITEYDTLGNTSRCAGVLKYMGDNTYAHTSFKRKPTYTTSGRGRLKRCNSF